MFARWPACGRSIFVCGELREHRIGVDRGLESPGERSSLHCLPHTLFNPVGPGAPPRGGNADIKKHRVKRCLLGENPTNQIISGGRGPTANARALLMQLHASAVATFPLK